jgi:hypothetical protein
MLGHTLFARQKEMSDESQTRAEERAYVRAMAMCPTSEGRISCFCPLCKEGKTEAIKVQAGERGRRRTSRSMVCSNVKCKAHSRMSLDRDVGMAAKNIVRKGRAQRGFDRPLDLEEKTEGQNRTGKRQQEGKVLHCRP